MTYGSRVPDSGYITLGHLNAEFGNGAPYSVSEYYRGTLVPNTVDNTAVPTSGPISLSNFYGSKGTNTEYILENEYKLPGNYTFTTPPNVTSIEVVAIGGGGAGAYNGCNGAGDGRDASGGGGAGVRGTAATSSGDQWTVVVAQKAPFNANDSGTCRAISSSDGGESRIQLGTTSITSGGGKGGYITSSGGFRSQTRTAVGGAGGTYTNSGFTVIEAANGQAGSGTNGGGYAPPGKAGLDGYGDVGPRAGVYAGHGGELRVDERRDGYVKITTHGTINYNIRGQYTFTVPAGKTSFNFILAGAGGGSGTGDGQGHPVYGAQLLGGALLAGTLPVSAGDVISLEVGGGGKHGIGGTISAPRAAGGSAGAGGAEYNGGAGGRPGPNGASGGGGGGGAATVVRVNGIVKLVAGGGAGSGGAGSRYYNDTYNESNPATGTTGDTNGGTGSDCSQADGGGAGAGGGGYNGGVGGVANGSYDTRAQTGAIGTNYVFSGLTFTSTIASTGASTEAADGNDGYITLTF